MVNGLVEYARKMEKKRQKERQRARESEETILTAFSTDI